MVQRERKNQTLVYNWKKNKKLKASFGLIGDRQLHRYYVEAARKRQNTPEVFMQMLECRLDNLVYRLNFAPTIFAAQQLVSHGHIEVDGKKTTIRSYRVRPGQVIAVREKSKQHKTLALAQQTSTRSMPAFLEAVPGELKGKVLSLPSLDSISLPMDINIPMVCDFVSHKG